MIVRRPGIYIDTSCQPVIQDLSGQEEALVVAQEDLLLLAGRLVEDLPAGATVEVLVLGEGGGARCTRVDVYTVTHVPYTLVWYMVPGKMVR